MAPVVGIIANPVSARDIRRVVANASSLQIADRASIVLRVLAALHVCGIKDVLMMPENGGIRGHVERARTQRRNRGEASLPNVEYAGIRVQGTVEDTHAATRLMCERGVAAIVVVGGDGTHRAVAKHCDSIPIAGISTGTNNAFPESRESTITGLAVGLAATGRIPAHVAFAANKRINVSINDGEIEDVAIVDVAVVTEHHIGARALWRTETFRELYVTFAEPQAIGMSAIAALLEPITRAEPEGLRVRMAPVEESAHVLHAPIAPGLVVPIGVNDWSRLPAGVPLVPEIEAGSLALDGERELSFSEHDRVELMLEAEAFRTIDVSAAMRYAAREGLLRRPAAPAFSPFGIEGRR